MSNKAPPEAAADSPDPPLRRGLSETPRSFPKGEARDSRRFVRSRGARGGGTNVALSTVDMTAPAKPAHAGRASRKKELPEHLKGHRHVWVFIEYERHTIHPVSLELLGEGRKLADKLGVELAGVLLGSDRAALLHASNECFEHGADVVYLVTDEVLAHYRNEPFTKAMTELVTAYKPEICSSGRRRSGATWPARSPRRS